MVAPKISGGGFAKGALGYDFEGSPGKQRTPPGEWVGGSCVGSNAAELLAQFKPILALRPEARKPVWRCSINLHPSDGRLTPAEWDIVSRRFLQLMGVNPDKAAWCSINHKDRPHDHAHVTLSRVLPDGSLWDRANDVRRAIDACAQIERESMQLLGRQLHQHDRTPKEKRGLTRGEQEIEQRVGRIMSREFIQLQVDQVLKAHADGIGLFEFVNELKGLGVEATPYLPKGQFKGMSYSAQGISWPGGKLGAGYTNTGLIERGVRYESEGSTAPTDAPPASVPAAPALAPVDPAAARKALDKARSSARDELNQARQAGVSEAMIKMAVWLAAMMARLLEIVLRLPQHSLGRFDYTPTAGVTTPAPTPAPAEDLARLARGQDALSKQLDQFTHAIRTGDLGDLPKLADERYMEVRQQLIQAQLDQKAEEGDRVRVEEERTRVLREGGHA